LARATELLEKREREPDWATLLPAEWAQAPEVLLPAGASDP
jgi:hypothetical protein